MAPGLLAWRLGRARRVPVFGRVGPPRRRVHDRWPACNDGPGRAPRRTGGRCPATAGPHYAVVRRTRRRGGGGARGGGADRVRASAGRLRLLRQIRDELIPGVEQFLLVDDVVAVEDGPALVAGPRDFEFQMLYGVSARSAGGAAMSRLMVRPLPRKRTRTRACIAGRIRRDARLAYLGHLLIENRHGLIADAMATVADGFAEREAATVMVVCHQWQRAPGRPPHGGCRQGLQSWCVCVAGGHPGRGGVGRRATSSETGPDCR